jgi:flavorubredoxin
MKAIVLFDTLFGNTERIASSLVRGLREAGLEAEYINISEVLNLDDLVKYDLIALGAPTHYLTASKPMKDLLDRLKDMDLRGKWGFAFDTKLDYFMAGSAARLIEKKLKACGLDIIKPHISAIVIGRKEKEKKKKNEIKNGDAILKEGEEEHFETVGKEIGKLVERRARKMEAA